MVRKDKNRSIHIFNKSVRVCVFVGSKLNPIVPVVSPRQVFSFCFIILPFKIVITGEHANA